MSSCTFCYCSVLYCTSVCVTPGNYCITGTKLIIIFTVSSYMSSGAFILIYCTSYILRYLPRGTLLFWLPGRQRRSDKQQQQLPAQPQALQVPRRLYRILSHVLTFPATPSPPPGLLPGCSCLAPARPDSQSGPGSWSRDRWPARTPGEAA